MLSCALQFEIQNPFKLLNLFRRQNFIKFSILQVMKFIVIFFHRTRYLTKERGVIVAIQDEVVGGVPEDCHQSPFEIILNKSKLAQDLKLIFDELCDTGIINVYVNKWINVSFCLPHKVHRNEEGRLRIEPDLLTDYASRIRPYHTVLLLDEERNLLSKLPNDCAPTLKRIIKMCSVIKSFQTLSQDTDISLNQIFSVVSHLVYWGKAIVIYPLAENNVYVISKYTPTNIDSRVAEKFKREFNRKTHCDLVSILARFSFPTTLGEIKNPIDSIHQHREHVNIVKWLLKQQLLKQLHTYVYFMPPDDDVDKSVNQEFSNLEFDDLDEPESASKEIWQSLSRQERLCILNMQQVVEPEDISFFLRIFPYFKGQHHLEEIMYYENVRRSELVTLIDKFRSILITTQHEDPATAYRA